MSGTPNEPWKPKVNEWLLDARQGMLSAEARREFNALLRSDPAARRYTRQTLQNDVALSEELRAAHVEQFFDSEHPVFPEQSASQRNGVSFHSLWAIAAALVAFLGMTSLWFIRNNPEAPAQQEPTSSGIAVLSRSIEAVWEASSALHHAGELLTPSWLRLKSGTVRIDFLSGATLVLEGPAELQLISSTESFCSQGKVYGEVPPQAHDFRIRGPLFTIQNLGSSFGLLVPKEGPSEVHALGGKCEVLFLENPTQKTLEAGTAFSVEKNGITEPIAMTADKFSTSQSLETRFTQNASQRFLLWRTAQQEPAPADLLLHYTFENTAGSTLENHGALKNPNTHGFIVGSQHAQGRWPEKAALDFKRASDRVRIQVPGEFDAVTWMGWIRVDSLPNRLNALVLDVSGNLHWQLTDSGQLQLGAPLGNGREKGLSPRIITPEHFGQWLHLCSSFDGINGKVCHYFNGQKVSESAVASGIKLRVGDADIGNWTPSGKHIASAIRNFNGRIDELLFFNRALSAEEVRHHFESGDPNFIPPLSSSIR